MARRRQAMLSDIPVVIEVMDDEADLDALRMLVRNRIQEMEAPHHPDNSSSAGNTHCSDEVETG